MAPLSLLSHCFCLALALGFAGLGRAHCAESRTAAPDRARFALELINDAVFCRDSHFSGAWTLQFLSERRSQWREFGLAAPLRWPGEQLPALENAHRRWGLSLGQSVFTPGDLEMDDYCEGELPYASVMTVALDWQQFNRDRLDNLQLLLGTLGDVALGEEIQGWFHEAFRVGKCPSAWHTQRKSEPIVNVGYLTMHQLNQWGEPSDPWTGSLTWVRSISVGNLKTSLESGLEFRWGWGVPKGFAGVPTLFGQEFRLAAVLPPAGEPSRHGFELNLGIHGTLLAYSVLYEGSLITADDRSVERRWWVLHGTAGIAYHWGNRLTVRFAVQQSSDLLKKQTLGTSDPASRITRQDFAHATLRVEWVL